MALQEMDPSGLLAQGMTAAWRLIDGYAGRTTNHLKETCRVMLHNREDSQKGFHADNVQTGSPKGGLPPEDAVVVVTVAEDLQVHETRHSCPLTLRHHTLRHP